MLAEIQLSAEQKFNVLLAAFAVFLSAALVSLCLALSICPLNRWLHKRDESHRKRQLELGVRQFRNLIQSHQKSFYTNYHISLRHTNHHSIGDAKCAPQPVGCLGPPPAYEAALRATGLQSLTSNSLIPADGAIGGDPPDSPDWLETALSNQMGASETCAPQLDLGDYFHSPRELLYAHASGYHRRQRNCNHQLAIQMETPPGSTSRPQAPVMLRLWVKRLEPDELIEWARRQTEADSSRLHSGNQRSDWPTDRARFPSLTKQLSIPQLFGSLITLASGSTGAKPDESAPEQPDCDKATELEAGQQPDWPSSSSSSSSSSLSASEARGRPRQPAADHSKPSSERRPRQVPSQTGPVRSITSRVLHMNVASFSYVKDENLISAKKHNQLNFQHFHGRPRSRPSEGRIEPPGGGKRKAPNKMCQLLVSICDIENLLGSSWLENRACLRLARNSSIYIKCEILAAKPSGAARLLRNPLRVLTYRDSTPSAGSHTIDFGPTLPAAAIEPRPSALARATSPSRSLIDRAELAAAVAPTGGNDSEQGNLSGLSASSTSDEGPTSETSNRPETDDGRGKRLRRARWRHEPAADGKAIVVFSSIPKQLAQQQEFAASALSSQTATSSSTSMTSAACQHSLDTSADSTSGRADHIDLIQFDSVFVSPILSKSLLERGHIRLRVYAQCKYVNETCLAELKLPLRQLMRSQSGDNLADASTGGQRAPPQQQQQADLILNHLLANLVTASFGAPLTTLMEQISAEERETAELETTRLGSRNLQPPGLADGTASPSLHRSSSSPSAGPLTSWLGGASDEGRAPAGQEPATTQEQLIEQNHCRSLMVSHWLNHLVAPSYECQLVEEVRGRLVLGLSYLPTSNRLVFNAHRASIEPLAGGGGGGGGNGQRSSSESHKQLVKRLRMQSDTSYLLRFIMLADGRVLKRRQTACARKPEWDSQEPVTFDLVSAAVERPTFIVALLMRNPHVLAAAAHAGTESSSGSLGASLQSPPRENYLQVRPCGEAEPERKPSVHERASACRSDLEPLGVAASGSGGPAVGKQARDLVVGHLVLADELWLELKAQPRRQIVRQFNLL